MNNDDRCYCPSCCFRAFALRQIPIMGAPAPCDLCEGRGICPACQGRDPECDECEGLPWCPRCRGTGVIYR